MRQEAAAVGKSLLIMNMEQTVVLWCLQNSYKCA